MNYKFPFFSLVDPKALAKAEPKSRQNDMGKIILDYSRYLHHLMVGNNFWEAKPLCRERRRREKKYCKFTLCEEALRSMLAEYRMKFNERIQEERERSNLMDAKYQ